MGPIISNKKKNCNKIFEFKRIPSAQSPWKKQNKRFPKKLTKKTGGIFAAA
jgi:hypothetical protein